MKWAFYMLTKSKITRRNQFQKKYLARSGHILHEIKVNTEITESDLNKKVLLRESKRHTDRGVSSTPSVTRGGVPPPARSDGGGGVPHLAPQARSDEGGTPQQGYPPARSDGGGGYLRWGTLAGVPPGQVWRSDGGYPRWGTPCRGTPLARSDGGYPPGKGTPQLDLAGYPPPFRGVDRQTPVKTVPYRCTTYAVGNYMYRKLTTDLRRLRGNLCTFSFTSFICT